MLIGNRNVSCAPRQRLSLQLGLSTRASVTVRFLSLRGVPLATRRLGMLAAGSRQMSLQLPAPLARPGRYRMIVLATVNKQIVRAEMQFSLARLRSRPGAQSAMCGAPGA